MKPYLPSPSALVGFTACVHKADLDRAARTGLIKRPHFRNTALEALAERGRKHERAHLEALRAAGLSIVELPSDLGAPSDLADAADRTLAAMREGVDVIYQATFVQDGWRGHADFLRRVEADTSLGAWGYEPWDAKLAREARASAVLQLCAYAEMIAKLQDREPVQMHLVLGDAESPVQSFRVAEFAPYFRQVKKQFLRHLGQVPPASVEEIRTYPDPCEHCDVCDWATECDKRWRKDDALALVAGISRNQRKGFTGRGVETLTALASVTLPLVPPLDRTSPTSVQRVQRQAHVQLAGRVQKQPVHELVLPIASGHGLAALPPPSEGDLFFDIEGDPFVEGGGREYLFGVVEPTGEAPKYHEFWGLSHMDERRAFEATIDLFLDRRMRDPGAHIYHFAPYEPSAVKRLSLRLGTRVDEVDDLLRQEAFIDLMQVVRQGVRASVESYSIKKLEPFYAFERAMDLRKAGDARAALELWLETDVGEGLPEKDALLETVRLYNRDDCLSTWKLRDWLETLREEAARLTGVEVPRPPPPATPTDDEKENEVSVEVARLKERLCSGIPDDPNARTQEHRARSLLAALLEWHRREKKSFWWEFFRLKKLDAPGMIEDPKPIGGIEYVGEVGHVKRSKVHRYRFPHQEHAIDEGDPVREPDTGDEFKLLALDTAARTFDISRAQHAPPPPIAALVPFKNISAKPLEESLRALAARVTDETSTAPRPEAALSLLLREAPDLATTSGGAEGATAIDSVLLMAKSGRPGVLPVQGPPGAGKTTVGAEMIVRLVEAGYRVGVTANSHAVIANLLRAACARARQEQKVIKVVQKPGQEGAGAVEDPFVTSAGVNKEVSSALESGVNVAAGTAWLWAALGTDPQQPPVDVLLIDEAGQLSLANALAVAPAARVVVLLGDPQQLAQPQQGVHPEGAEVSALEHLLNGGATIPEGRGVFLGSTWRLSPSLCAYTSELFYEGRLRPRDGCASQALEAPAPWGGAGLRWLPVEHVGNQSESPEEVAAIAQLHADLTAGGVTWTDSEGVARQVTAEEVLIVAPYNDQVAALKRALPGARVGTVDKFQGQEAPVVIYSLATSSPEDAPRGMAFLYDLHRLNVATSRARCIAVIAGSPALLRPSCRTPEQMRQAAALCRVVERAGHAGAIEC